MSLGYDLWLCDASCRRPSHIRLAQLLVIELVVDQIEDFVAVLAPVAHVVLGNALHDWILRSNEEDIHKDGERVREN